MKIYKIIKLIILIFSLYILYTAVGLFFESGLEHSYSRGCQRYLDFTSYSFHYSIFLVITLIPILIYIIILDKTPLKSEQRIDAFIMTTDPLNIAQDTSLLLPGVNGIRHYLFPTDLPSFYNGHSMDNVLKKFLIKNP